MTSSCRLCMYCRNPVQLTESYSDMCDSCIERCCLVCFSRDRLRINVGLSLRQCRPCITTHVESLMNILSVITLPSDLWYIVLTYLPEFTIADDMLYSSLEEEEDSSVPMLCNSEYEEDEEEENNYVDYPEEDKTEDLYYMDIEEHVRRLHEEDKQRPSFLNTVVCCWA